MQPCSGVAAFDIFNPLELKFHLQIAITKRRCTVWLVFPRDRPSGTKVEFTVCWAGVCRSRVCEVRIKIHSREGAHSEGCFWPPTHHFWREAIAMNITDKPIILETTMISDQYGIVYRTFPFWGTSRNFQHLPLQNTSFPPCHTPQTDFQPDRFSSWFSIWLGTSKTLRTSKDNINSAGRLSFGCWALEKSLFFAEVDSSPSIFVDPRGLL